MSRAARFKQADATRALKAAVAAGLMPSGVRIGVDGSIEVMIGNAPAPRPALDNPWDAELR